MAGPLTKVSFLLTGSLDEQTTEEMRGPLLQQNGSPSLSDQHNTRLSVLPGTCVRAPAVLAQGVQLAGGVVPLGADPAGQIQAHGIVGNARKRNYALYTTPDSGNRVIADDGFETRGTGYVTERDAVGRQTGYMPWQLARAGQIPDAYDFRADTDTRARFHSGISSSYNATDDILWHAWLRSEFGLPAIEVCAYNHEGVLICRPTIVVTQVSGQVIGDTLGLTAHGPNGTRLWYKTALSGSPEQVYCRPLTIVDGNIGAVGVAVPVGDPSATSFGVTAASDTEAYLASTDEGVPTLYRASILDGSASRVTLGTDTTATGGFAAVNRVLLAGGQQLVAATFCGPGTSARWTRALVDQSLAVQYADQSSPLGYEVGGVACGVLLSPELGVQAGVFAHAKLTGGFPVAWEPLGSTLDDHVAKVAVVTHFLGSGVASPTRGPIYHSRLLNRGAQWQVSETEAYPLLFTFRGDANIAQGGGIDPSAVAYIVSAVDDSYGASAVDAMLTPVARFGVVRGLLSPIEDPLNFVAAAESVAFMHGAMVVTYRKDDLGASGRFVHLSTRPSQPSVVQDRDGVGILGAALVTQWDGAETHVFGGPLYAPQMRAYLIPDAATPLPAGAYGLTAIYEWIDNAGLYHRSMPWPTSSLTLTGTEAIGVLIATPSTMEVGWAPDGVKTTLYMTDPNGTAYMRQPALPFQQWGFVGAEITSVAEGPIIYSRGLENEELVPQPPPPLRDVTIVGSRAWGVDAEVPTRLVYSKLRVAGIGYEFFPAGEVVVSSNAGDIIAIREMSGTLVIFAERGVWQLSDGGPNNLGQGGSFGSPYQLSDVGTTNRLSVIGTPMGIVFATSSGHIAALTPGGVVPLAGVEVDPETIVGAFLLDYGEEACLVAGATVFVFNWAVKRWSKWDLPLPPMLCAQSAITRNHGLLYMGANGRTYTVDGTSLSPTLLMRWETDWILLGGDFQDYCVLYDVWFNAYSVSAHGIRIELFTDYGDTPTTLREWTSAELVPVLNPRSRYTVRVEPVRQDARAIKVRVTELAAQAPYHGCRPGTVTLVYSIDGLTYEEVSIPGAYK